MTAPGAGKCATQETQMPFIGPTRPPAFPAASTAGFPTTRMRRNRRTDWSRRLVAETRFGVDDLIWPVFVHAGDEPRIPVPSMPGVVRHSVPALVDAVGAAAALGIPMVGVFPFVDPPLTDPRGGEPLASHNPQGKAT